jgi:phosphate transport system permease protein
MSKHFATIAKLKDKTFQYFGIFCTFFGLVMLVIFISSIFSEGISRIDWDFLTNFPSRRAEKAGILSALAGTLWIIVITALVAIPIGIGAAIYLEEFSKKSRFGKIIELNITNLAGVPSIIYGLLGLEIFGRIMGMGGSILAGSFTLALLILPIIIVATREAIKAVPSSLREASFALGASKWQTVKMTVVPSASSGIITGIIIAISRAAADCGWSIGLCTLCSGLSNLTIYRAAHSDIQLGFPASGSLSGECLRRNHHSSRHYLPAECIRGLPED